VLDSLFFMRRNPSGDLLIQEGKVVPVCNAELVNHLSEVSVDMIAQLPLLHLSSREGAWKQWFSSAGLERISGR
jgi:hypothetical protein